MDADLVMIWLALGLSAILVFVACMRGEDLAHADTSSSDQDDRDV